MPTFNLDISDLSSTIIEKRYPEFYQQVEDYSKNLNLLITFKESLFMYYHDLTSLPVCKVCGGLVRFKGFKIGYTKFCSSKCNGIHKKSLSLEDKEKIIGKRKSTNQEKYGADFFSKTEMGKEKIKQTNLDKWGQVSPILNKTIREKRDLSYQNNWGGHPLSDRDLIKKRLNNRKNTMNDQWVKDLLPMIGINYDVLGFDFTNREVKIKCQCGYISTYKSHFIKQRFELGIGFCLKCNPPYSKHLSKNKKTFSKYKSLKLNDVDLLDYDGLNFKCRHLSQDHQFIISWKNLYDRYQELNSIICTTCNPIGNIDSSHQRSIANFLLSEGEIVSYNVKNVINGDLDIYLEDKKIAIEFNGLYWHSENFKEKDYHLKKSQECIDKGIFLIHIWEDEWLNKKEIIKSIILNRIGKIENKIYARNCEIRELNSPKIVKDFLNGNHIQGYSNSTYKIGLYHQNELVSLMTFGWRYTNSKREFELIRFCNKINTNVVGSSSKIFKYFINKYTEYKKIISYSDFRMFEGGLYQKLGFQNMGLSKPDYFWVNGRERKHRFNFNKKKLVKMGYDSQKTEVEIMHSLKYYRIWGCGQYRWEYKK